MSSPSSKRLLVGLTIFVLVIALGELVALFMDYQNNTYLQQYVTSNRPLIFEQTIGLLLFGIGAAFLALKVSTLTPTGKLARTARRVWGLSPIFAAVVALVLWVSVFSEPEHVWEDSVAKGCDFGTRDYGGRKVNASST